MEWKSDLSIKILQDRVLCVCQCMLYLSFSVQFLLGQTSTEFDSQELRAEASEFVAFFFGKTLGKQPAADGQPGLAGWWKHSMEVFLFFIFEMHFFFGFSLKHQLLQHFHSCHHLGALKLKMMFSFQELYLKFQ